MEQSLKLLKSLIMFQRELYSLYINAFNNTDNPLGKSVLETICTQTQEKIDSLLRIYGIIMLGSDTLDEGSKELLLFAKEKLSQDYSCPSKLMQACCCIEHKINEIYGNLAKAGNSEIEFQELLKHDNWKKEWHNLADNLLQIDGETNRIDDHQCVFSKDLLQKWSQVKPQN